MNSSSPNPAQGAGLSGDGLESSHPVFGTKADTLDRLAKLLRLPKLCDQFVLTVEQWSTDPNAVVKMVQSRFNGVSLVVRSSATDEDTLLNSNAGAFLSVTGVESSASAIAEAIDRVIASYRVRRSVDQVLIQPMVENVVISGVVLSRDLETGSPYYVVNYDDFSGRTDTVTGGAVSKCIRINRARPESLHSTRFRKLIDIVMEIEAATCCCDVDVEFCITDSDEVYLLQARPVAVPRPQGVSSDPEITAALRDIRTDLAKRLSPCPGVLGKSTIFGEMPDWNPAEMLGNTPRPLAMSLYQKLITDSTWARSRATMGYRDLGNIPLLVAFAGRPYIDVRLSLNSFLPASLDEGIAARLVDYQIDWLATHPELHDKVEFSVAITCRDFAFDTHTRKLREAGLDPTEIEDFEVALRALTANAVGQSSVTLEQILGMTDRLLQPAPTEQSEEPLNHIRALIEEGIRYGTLPFSILARHAFIGTAFLKSLVFRDALDLFDAERLMRGIDTVAGEVARAIHGVARGQLAIDYFLARYGHLRPGTYDIMSWRYDEKPELFLNGSKWQPEPVAPFRLSAKQTSSVAQLLDESRYQFNPAHLVDYITSAIAARERAKFAFTRSVSEILACLGRWGDDVGLSREALSFLPISSIFEHGNDLDRLRDLISTNRSRHAITRAVHLPSLITEQDDIDVVRQQMGQPTFITAKSVTAQGQSLATESIPEIDGRILLIENADPGFDWIFSHPIAGLVTKYGGANSHMAIRCAEFGLPAAIGCGEQLFTRLSHASVIELNCGARTVRRADN